MRLASRVPVGRRRQRVAADRKRRPCTRPADDGEGEGAVGVPIDCVLKAAAKAGYRLRLETAPLNDAVKREKDRIAHVVSPSNLQPSHI